MAGINTLILNQGVGKAIQAQNDQGFFIKLTSFSISETAGAFERTRTSDNTLWFKTLITTTTKIDDNTIELICEVPPQAIDRQTNQTVTDPKEIAEVYVYGEDENQDEFIFAIAHPSASETYDPQGSYEIRLQIKLLNVTVDSVYSFSYSQAKEISLHNTSPIAHSNLMWDLVEFDDSFEAPQNRVSLVKHDVTVSEVVVKLPVPEAGKKVCIKDGVGDPIGKRIKIVPSLNELIDQFGNGGYYFKYPYESKTLMSDGTNWYFIWSESEDVSSTGTMHIGDPNNAGSWRIRTDGDKLYLERSQGGGVFETKDIVGD